MRKNNIQEEITRIRLELYEETKHMTPVERGKWSSDLARKLAAQYGFTIVTSISETPPPQPTPKPRPPDLNQLRGV